MTTLAELSSILCAVRSKQTEVALQAFEAHAPWPMPVAVAFFVAAGHDEEMALGLIISGLMQDLLTARNADGERIDPREIVEDTDINDVTFHLGPQWQATPEAFGLNIGCKVEEIYHKGKEDQDLL